MVTSQLIIFSYKIIFIEHWQKVIFWVFLILVYVIAYYFL